MSTTRYRTKLSAAIGLVAMGSSLALIQGCLPNASPAGVPQLNSKPATAAAAGLPAYESLGALPNITYADNVVPDNPFLDPNRNGAHEKTYNSDVTKDAGPLGNNPSVVTHKFDFLAAACPSVLFDDRNRIVTVCITPATVTLYLLDPNTLKTLSKVRLPPKKVNLTGENNASGGGYVHMDAQGRVVVGPSDNTIRRYSIVGNRFIEEDRIDVDTLLAQAGVSVSGSIEITDTVLDYQGRMWFTSAIGLVGYVDESVNPVSVKTYDFGVNLQNQVAIDPSGVYAGTIDSLNKLVVNGSGDIVLAWSKAYTSSGSNQTGLGDGSGTSPTLFGTGGVDTDGDGVLDGDIVAITDNDASQLHINLYDRADGELICSYPIFQPGKGAAENSPAGYQDQIVISNNYGFPGFFSGSPFDVEKGLVKVEANRDGSGVTLKDAVVGSLTACSQVWYQQDIKATPVPFLSTATGLIYTYSLKRGNYGYQGWYLDLVDWDTGLTVNRTWVGNGKEFDNIIQQVTITPDGGAIVSVRNGLVLVRDN